MIVGISTSLGSKPGWLQVAFWAADKQIDKRFKHVCWVWYPGYGWRRA